MRPVFHRVESVHLSIVIRMSVQPYKAVLRECYTNTTGVGFLSSRSNDDGTTVRHTMPVIRQGFARMWLLLLPTQLVRSGSLFWGLGSLGNMIRTMLMCKMCNETEQGDSVITMTENRRPEDAADEIFMSFWHGFCASFVSWRKLMASGKRPFMQPFCVFCVCRLV